LSTFVTVGNATQPFDRLLRVVVQATAVLPRPIVVQRGASRVSHSDWICSDYLSIPEFERLVATSSVLIMHCGAGSIINALRCGKRPLVMARRFALGEHIDDHQVELADALHSAAEVITISTADELIQSATAAASRQSAIAVRPSQLLLEISRLLCTWDKS
jgi:UDP-N-acetylglucosamine transferase subunit ALG13